MLRILCLPGYTQNAYILRKKMATIRKTCRDVAHFDFYEPVHVVHPTDLPEEWRDAFDARCSDTADPIQDTPRAHWFLQRRAEGHPHGPVYSGFDAALEAMKDHLSEKNAQGEAYDGVLGFSQGGCFAAIVAYLLEDTGRQQMSSFKGVRHPPMRFVISVGGFRPAPVFQSEGFVNRDWFGPSAASIRPTEEEVGSEILAGSPEFSEVSGVPCAGLITPSWHICGRNDPVVVPERSQALIDVSENAQVDRHDGGHFIPSSAEWRGKFKSFLEEQLDRQKDAKI